MKHASTLAFLWLSACFPTIEASPTLPASAETRTVKVFILSGQSNMVGWSHVRTLPRLGEDPRHATLFNKLSGSGARWVVRDDVFIDSNVDDKVRRGMLSVGYGGGGEAWIGPEFAFGVEMGDLYDEPVLLIKAAWGGKDLYCDFRPPSAGQPSYRIPPRGDKERDMGVCYRLLVAEVHRALDDMGKNFPKLKDKEVELAGLVWFQGWNEMFADKTIQDQVYAEYASNFAHFVKDLREEFDAPKLPVVIGELGVNGEGANERTQKLRAAQAGIPKQDSLRGSALFVKTAHLWDQEVDDAFDHREKVRRDLFRELEPGIAEMMKSELKGEEDKKQKTMVRNATNKALRKSDEYIAAEKAFERVGSHWECHYHGSAKMYSLIGQALAEGMGKLVADPAQ